MLVVNTISKIDVFMGRSSVDLIALRNDIDEWLNSATPMGSYDPLTELYEDAPDESYCPKSSIVEELIEEIQNEFKGNPKESQLKSKGNTKAISRDTKEIQRTHKGEMGTHRKCKGYIKDI